MRQPNRRSRLRLLTVLLAAQAWVGPPQETRLSGDDQPQTVPSSEIRSPGADVSSAPETPPIDKPKQRQREGVKLTDRRGRFERRGERYVFLSDAPVSQFMVLENLMLERVANVLADAAGGQLRWSVSGTITEYRGVNYVLLDRAVVKASQDDLELQPRPGDSPAKTTSRLRPKNPTLR